jgi:hypothetical protein
MVFEVAPDAESFTLRLGDLARPIDTEAKAYWLGFLAADGCNTNGCLKVSLSSRDRDHLARLRATLQSGHPISERAIGGYNRRGTTLASSLTIKSASLTAGLAAHGVVPRKTFVLEWPAFLPPALLRHYLRGYSDGDGCFHVSKGRYTRKRDGQKSRDAHWIIVGNEGFWTDVQGYLMETVGFSRTKLRPSPNAKSAGIVQLAYAGNKQIARLGRLLYNDATVYLFRKRDKIAYLL